MGETSHQDTRPGLVPRQGEPKRAPVSRRNWGPIPLGLKSRVQEPTKHRYH